MKRIDESIQRDKLQFVALSTDRLIYNGKTFHLAWVVGE